MEINKVSFSYQAKKKTLKNINCTIEKGKVTSIIGPNGCGKSTLLNMMNKQLSPTDGNVLLNGKNISQYKLKAFAKKVAVVYQRNEVPNELSVEQLVRFGRLPYKTMFAKPSKEEEEEVYKALEWTKLLNKKNDKVSSLSGGEQQRVWIAMAIAQRTSILFLDEPTTYLDLFHQYEVLQLVQKLNEDEGLTIAMVLHDINQAIQFSDYLIIMKDGEIFAEGSPSEIITEQLIKKIYGIDVKVFENSETGLYVIPVSVNTEVKSV
ncbi:ABC transporter ATP-binding protein [Pontibacillus litoralis]|uniref:Iron ABC transporter ATP-binding protein n=1 Tax=Pontibacillus litoralis JSM 072002 TaxID=1385512 RepID=A0A0A5FZH6_9BACI|nr:ABC transporter ATP-binding protein [Pontibacillus litoralis]KGX86241.1 iron ABC transporter ATP-binding protein [Pontibacillus litoralis JSM 072002]